MRLSNLPATLLIACAVVFLTITFGRLPGDGMLLQMCQNTLHTALFGIFSFFTLRYLRTADNSSRAPGSTYLLVAGLCAAIGIATESAQWLTGRGFGSVDIVRDAAGVILGTGLYALIDQTKTGALLVSGAGLRRTLIGLLCCVLLAAIYPLTSLSWHYVLRNNDFPVIMDPYAQWATTFVGTNRASITLSSENCGTRQAELSLEPTAYPGIALLEPYPDWRIYRYLTFTLESRQPETFSMTLRINDAAHNDEYDDRYNQALTIAPGSNTYRIPLEEIIHGPRNRKLDIGDICGLQLFSRDLTRPQQVCVSAMKLEN